ncbi:hypothetical protein COS55_01930 [Candidatus Shapirobacteria bacterium CG03_land_8_20_14_0_80_40_19]|uniref:Glutamine amidotransferase type-2 domain-containing protein n=4 Tax=Candidatus Shapironibacteriota TaxID=1752721 RepID=A0A2M7BDY6_9BACT|nr:MAG: hypothetical protein COV89_01515 [Candidatus Shapirobacteria bacterium CG11_big_fil_rev_8_21_14_0_20_40_12]PIV01311.1 MAG: hypothetical protein COS55_01930 [Candidatus Shapirobacteria bacterium CG03_land_8_20_14_0_80_40_19]PJC29187.1 MAG: hypothetical protein CO053_00510 [Candidatus Shapirobacteria bacterium CG_4_9_14_0_2_um_filter_40_11]PJC76646.1 MAG: hypothetical protein CO010_02015 [Candidatus Shapirobacteria bacterium CG_4_8_14_3_um_filter_39_11]
MCRFLLAKFENPTKPEELLKEFSSMAKKSKAYDGDWQGDGWGISWVDEKGLWQTRKSLLPVWEEGNTFESFPKTLILAAHARSASFPNQKGVIEYNQPFVDEPYVFVFNGLLKKVSLSSRIPGEIGSQKIWFLLRKLLKRLPPLEALKKVKNVLREGAVDLQALNIGLCDKKNLYLLNYYSQYPDYYRLYLLDHLGKKIICSEKLVGFDDFKPSPLIVLKL